MENSKIETLKRKRVFNPCNGLIYAFYQEGRLKGVPKATEQYPKMGTNKRN